MREPTVTAAHFVAAIVVALLALLRRAIAMPRGRPHQEDDRSTTAPLDFSPVFRNRADMAWIAGYIVNTWEVGVLRARGVTFLAAAIAWHGAPAWPSRPTCPSLTRPATLEMSKGISEGRDAQHARVGP